MRYKSLKTILILKKKILLSLIFLKKLKDQYNAKKQTHISGFSQRQLRVGELVNKVLEKFS